MEFNTEFIESVVNRTYPGLAMYVRDANLPDEMFGKYKRGMIVREKGFCDASSRVMGMVTTHRYAILSNHMADLSQFEHGTNWGLHVAKSDSRFKVLAKYEFNGKKLMLLLHLPDDESWRLFREMEFNLDEQIIENCIERFRNKCELDAVPELARNDWLERCSFPIGMDEDGNLFDVD